VYASDKAVDIITQQKASSESRACGDDGVNGFRRVNGAGATGS